MKRVTVTGVTRGARGYVRAEDGRNTGRKEEFRSDRPQQLE